MEQQGRAAVCAVDNWYVTGHAPGLGSSLTVVAAGVGTTGFVLSLSWLSSVTAGHTKRVTTNAIMLIAYCVGNAAAPFMWQAKYQPR